MREWLKNKDLVSEEDYITEIQEKKGKKKILREN